MITFHSLTMRNFMSVGNVTQVIELDDMNLTLVLGENLDTGTSSSRNGAGKTTIINALSYALYGQALTKIKVDNLINKTNFKNMLVTVNFSIGKNSYTIERGRKPNTLGWKVNNGLVNAPETDESEGDSKWTQREITKTLSISHMMFKHIIALNTFTEPFLAMKAGDQRSVIEELLGVTLLSEKSEVLRDNLKETKDAIKFEETRIAAKKEANTSIEKSIVDLERRERLHKMSNDKQLKTLLESEAELSKVDLESELKIHENLSDASKLHDTLSQFNKDKTVIERAAIKLQGQLTSTEKQLAIAKSKHCPLCEQKLSSHKHIDLTESLQETMESVKNEINVIAVEYGEVIKNIEDASSKLADFGNIDAPFYSKSHEAMNHKATLDAITLQISNMVDTINPYSEQIETLKTKSLSVIEYDTVNELSERRIHQDFLVKLLTDKGSFIRKKIIDQNLAMLNFRLSFYLEKIGLPHEVNFKNDLSVEITQLGRDFDFDNLSRGERNRLILSLSWAFRDVFENMNVPINLMFIDELVDSGMDTGGVESALEILKKISRERNKNIFLISHREELISRVNTVMTVKKDGGFTSFEYNGDM